MKKQRGSSINSARCSSISFSLLRWRYQSFRGSIPCLEDALSWCFLDGTIFNILDWYFFSGQMLSSFRVQFVAEHYYQIECILIQYLGDYIKEY
jgi:hypothetical protein